MASAPRHHTVGDWQLPKLSISRRHHYVPRFLLREWARPASNGQIKILAHYWDVRQGRLKSFPGGESQFCYRDDLFSLSRHEHGKDAIERIFFKEVDDAAARAHRKILGHGVRSLTDEERSDLVRLLLSLDARRPGAVSQLVERGSKHYANGLDNDEDILESFKRAGVNIKPSEYFEELTGNTLADQAMLSIQALTNNPSAGARLMNMRWGVYRLSDADGRFVLSDRPFIRVNPLDGPNALCALPLSPALLLLISGSDATVDNIRRLPVKRVRMLANSDSAMQADRYVFSIEDEGWWLERRLKMPRGAVPEITDSFMPRREWDRP